MQAICALLYDNTVAEEGYTEQENLIRAGNATLLRAKLIKRKDIIIELRHDIWDYVKDIVFPQIELNHEN